MLDILHILRHLRQICLSLKEGVALNCVWELECALMCEFSCKCQKNVVKCRYTFYLVLRWMWLIHNIRLYLQLFVISTHIIGNLQYTKYALLWTWISWMRDEMYTFTPVRVYKLVHLSKIYLRSLRKSFLWRIHESFKE